MNVPSYVTWQRRQITKVSLYLSSPYTQNSKPNPNFRKKPKHQPHRYSNDLAFGVQT